MRSNPQQPPLNRKQPLRKIFLAFFNKLKYMWYKEINIDIENMNAWTTGWRWSNLRMNIKGIISPITPNWTFTFIIFISPPWFMRIFARYENSFSCFWYSRRRKVVTVTLLIAVNFQVSRTCVWIRNQNNCTYIM